MRKFFPFTIGLISFLFLFPESVFAHSFGKLYSLPVPFWMYMYGSVAAIIASFLVIGYFFNKSNVSDKYSRFDLSKFKFFRFFTTFLFRTSLKMISVFVFILTIVSGFTSSESYSSFNMTFFWIIFVLGLTYLTALVGNVYIFINPYKVMAEWIERLFKTKLEGMYAYPGKLGYYPALLFYLLFIYIELFGNSSPITLSLMLLQYTIFTGIGIATFGKSSWFKYCDLFSVFFRLVGKIAPIEYLPSTKKKSYGSLALRPPFVGLLKEKADDFSMLLFILFILSSTAYDGLRETTFWTRLFGSTFNHALNPLFGDNSYQMFQLLGLIFTPLIFLVIYLAFIVLTKIVTKHKQSVKELSLSFAFSLIPIAFVYHVAHYFTLLSTEGLNIISLISDPLGLGWDIFGTVSWSSGIFAIDSGFVWHAQVALILIGHIASVYLSHIVALRLFPSHKKALGSQVPMLFLMVAFTAIGLWVLSQPITSGDIIDTSTQPSDEMLQPDFDQAPMFIPPTIDTNSIE